METRIISSAAMELIRLLSHVTSIAPNKTMFSRVQSGLLSGGSGSTVWLWFPVAIPQLRVDSSPNESHAINTPQSWRAKREGKLQPHEGKPSTITLLKMTIGLKRILGRRGNECVSIKGLVETLHFAEPACNTELTSEFDDLSFKKPNF